MTESEKKKRGGEKDEDARRERRREEERRKERGKEERDLGEVPPGADTPNVLFKVQKIGSEGRKRIVEGKKMHGRRGGRKGIRFEGFCVRNVPVHIFRVLDGKWF